MDENQTTMDAAKGTIVRDEQERVIAALSGWAREQGYISQARETFEMVFPDDSRVATGDWSVPSTVESLAVEVSEDVALAWILEEDRRIVDAIIERARQYHWCTEIDRALYSAFPTYPGYDAVTGLFYHSDGHDCGGRAHVNRDPNAPGFCQSCGYVHE